MAICNFYKEDIVLKIPAGLKALNGVHLLDSGSLCYYLMGRGGVWGRFNLLKTNLQANLRQYQSLSICFLLYVSGYYTNNCRGESSLTVHVEML